MKEINHIQKYKGLTLPNEIKLKKWQIKEINIWFRLYIRHISTKTVCYLRKRLNRWSHCVHQNHLKLRVFLSRTQLKKKNNAVCADFTLASDYNTKTVITCWKKTTRKMTLLPITVPMVVHLKQRATVSFN